jgi:hypothetical protein
MATSERGDRAEVAVVEGQHAGSTELSSQDDNRSVCQSEFKVGVLLVQSRGQCVLVRGQSLYQESPSRHVTQERRGGAGSPATPEATTLPSRLACLQQPSWSGFSGSGKTALARVDDFCSTVTDDEYRHNLTDLRSPLPTSALSRSGGRREVTVCTGGAVIWCPCPA